MSVVHKWTNPRFRFGLRSALIVLTVAALICGIWRASEPIYLWLRYGPQVELAAVSVPGSINGSSLLLEIEGRRVWTARSRSIEGAAWAQIWPEPAARQWWNRREPDTRIRCVWRTNDPHSPYIVRIGDEFVSTRLAGAERPSNGQEREEKGASPINLER